MSLRHVLPWLRLGLLIAGLGALASLVGATSPVFAMPVDRGSYPTALPAPQIAATGAAALFGLDDGTAIFSSTPAQTLVAATGAKMVRITVEWDALEPVRGKYDFKPSDLSLNRLLGAGLAPVVYLSKNPSWAANTDCGPVNTKDPTLVASFANAMGALAKRYPGVRIWAAYNEVDNAGDPKKSAGGCFGSPTNGGVNNNNVKDVEEYAILLAAAHKAVHAVNPQATFAGGAVAFDNFNTTTAPSGYPGGGSGGTFNYNFTANLYKYMKSHPLPLGQKYMDMQLLNYYDFYGRYWEKVAPGHGIQAKATALRARMTSAGIPVVPLFVSETGEESRDVWIGLNGQAKCLTIGMVRGAAADLKGVMWWTFKDFADTEPPPRNTWKYGIVDQKLVPKPSYTSLKSLVTELNAYKYAKTLSDTTGFTGVEAYQFKKDTLLKIVVWSNSIASQTYKPGCSWQRNTRVATFTAKKLRVVDYLGKVTLIDDNSLKDTNKVVGKIAINVAGGPQIVQINP